jgi:hypothetical protein
VVGTPVITDSNANPVSVFPDTIVTCAPTQIALGSIQAIAVKAGCLKMFNGEWLTVTWSGGTGISTEVTQERNGNLAFRAGNGKYWTAQTTFAGNANGPGCLFEFEGNARMIVENCAGSIIWDTTTVTYPDAVLAFESDGNLVIYATASPTATALWSTKTY